MKERERYLYFFKRGENQININHQPTFYDALQLIKRPEISTYHKLPIKKNTPIILHYIKKQPPQYKLEFEKKILFVHDVHAGDLLKFLSCFLIKDGERVTYMTNKRNAPGVVSKRLQN
ncbi:hypothetical protein ACUXCC_000214 [Cytobacillus horneckiae]|uniref:Uncharacterized protein n=1 Tax=Cytobacillus horneckiae TaxID=549687 RepID=A0A2N0ZFT8_9BACI|nr:hypothetical protein [Cytobacillus horneckiae]MBN6885080.1 hypothetical protein [Cytobacillus horneckiae]MCM3179175.1 hypothetical protein [Cytobacillus horneckiae]MEC1154397.1 hypothetical protein [Cytobacillus horneckiae]MED2937732.1 hypothetical protein [Cytobacillus horneckiae]PKG28380.1 hypothetical protein CWS20_14330 [Cytobacillus horneckiae]